MISEDLVFETHKILQDLAIEEAEKTKADYVLAQDPDADRFTAAERRFFV